jgi:hypothetical protein
MINEPENHTIIGWGSIISGAVVRIDEYVYENDDPYARWFPINDNSLTEPMTWKSIVASVNSSADLFILEKKSL